MFPRIYLLLASFLLTQVLLAAPGDKNNTSSSQGSNNSSTGDSGVIKVEESNIQGTQRNPIGSLLDEKIDKEAGLVEEVDSFGNEIEASINSLEFGPTAIQ